MSFHVDTMEMANRLREQIKQQKLPENPQPHMLVKVRSGGETQVAATVMFFSELNRGTDPMVIMSTMSSIVAEWIQNVASGFPEDFRPDVYAHFLDDLSRMMDQIIDGEQFTASDTVKVPFEKGGHA